MAQRYVQSVSPIYTNLSSSVTFVGTSLGPSQWSPLCLEPVHPSSCLRAVWGEQHTHSASGERLQPVASTSLLHNSAFSAVGFLHPRMLLILFATWKGTRLSRLRIKESTWESIFLFHFYNFKRKCCWGRWDGVSQQKPQDQAAV